eukprot:6400298-Amphidinium_carterae.1
MTCAVTMLGRRVVEAPRRNYPSSTVTSAPVCSFTPLRNVHRTVAHQVLLQTRATTSSLIGAGDVDVDGKASTKSKLAWWYLASIIAIDVAVMPSFYHELLP